MGLISLELVVLVANIAAIYSLLAIGMNMHWATRAF
jgi:branched-chain amino acid transport system permease protein